MQQLPLQAPIFLVELLDLSTEDIIECDVTAYLENAIEAAYTHLANLLDQVTPEVTIDRDGELEGIAFLGPNEEQYAFITAYYLNRDAPAAEFESIRTLAAQPLSGLQAGLRAIFR